MSTTKAGPVVLVGECTTPGRHLMVAVTVDPVVADALRASVAEVLTSDGLWCGPGAASPLCRAQLRALLVAGGVVAEVVDAADYDDPARAREACLGTVAELADAAGATRVVLARDDACAAGDISGSGALARRVGASPGLCFTHADTEGEPLTAVAEVLVWCWAQGEDTRRSVSGAWAGLHVV